MIRVTCPSCQKPHQFLDFYRGLTIYCKYCKAGITVPQDAESAPESAAPPPPINDPPPVVPVEAESNHKPDPAAAPVLEATRAELAPAVESNHRIQPADLPPPVSAAEPMPEPMTPLAPSRVQFEDEAPPPNKKRVMILAGVLILILAVGAALVARSFMPRGGGVVIDLKKSGEKSPEKKHENPPPESEKKTPEVKPIDEPKSEKEKSKETPAKQTDVVLAGWYLTEDVPYVPPSTRRYFLGDDELDMGLIFLVVKVRLSASALMAKKSGDKWTFHLEAEQFVVQDDKGQKAMADGFELKGGFIELADKEIRLIKKQTEETASEPTDHEVSVIFVAPEAAANESKLTLQFRDFPKVKIDASTKRAAPALPPPPKTTEPAKKIEDKTPPKKEEVKKTDETPKKIEPAKKPDDAPKKVEIAKKIEETPKKIETPKPPEVKKADPRADVEVVEWIITDTLPGADPKTKAMPLSSSDRLDGNTFIAVKVKLSGKACAAMKGEVTWKVRLAAKDFSIEGDAPQPFAGRGLEREGNYGSTVVSGYFPWADLVLPFEEEPEFLVQGVFFTIPRTVVARGDLTLFFRDSPPVKLAEGKRKK